jgi:hypothetical protein
LSSSLFPRLPIGPFRSGFLARILDVFPIFSQRSERLVRPMCFYLITRKNISYSIPHYNNTCRFTLNRLLTVEENVGRKLRTIQLWSRISILTIMIDVFLDFTQVVQSNAVNPRYKRLIWGGVVVRYRRYPLSLSGKVFTKYTIGYIANTRHKRRDTQCEYIQSFYIGVIF